MKKLSRIDTFKLILHRLVTHTTRDRNIRKSIQETRESILRLEILTAELEAKDEIMRSHEKLLAIAIDDMEVALWGKGLDGRFVFLNEICAEKILHVTVSDAMALTDIDFANDALAVVCMQSDAKVLESKRTRRFIEHAIYPDGHSMWIDTTKSPWIIDGCVQGTVGFGKDMCDIVPDEIKEKYKKSASVEIAVDLVYNVEDIKGLMGANHV